MADFAIDSNMMILIIIIIVFAVIAAPGIAWLVNLILRRRDRMVESPIDVHEMIIHKWKKAAKANMRGLRLKRLVCLGDSDYPSVEQGKLKGLSFSLDCCVVMVRTFRRPLSHIKPFIIPVEVVRDVYGRNLRIECRGFTPFANFFVPIWTNTTSAKDRLRYEKIIDDFMEFTVTREKNEELLEQNVNAMIEAINAKRRAPDVYARDEEITQRGGGEPGETEEQIT